MNEWNWKQASMDFVLKTLRYVTMIAVVMMLSAAIVLSVFIVKAGDAAEPETVLGLMDRIAAEQAGQRAHEIARINAVRGNLLEVAADLADYDSELDYCWTTDHDRVELNLEEGRWMTLEGLNGR